MKDLTVIAKFPEVVGAVLSDLSGALIDSVGNVDGEAASAVHSFSLNSLRQAGDLLGLGTFQRCSIVGPGKACVITIEDGAVLGVYVDPSKPLAAVEKKLQDSLQK